MRLYAALARLIQAQQVNDDTTHGRQITGGIFNTGSRLIIIEAHDTKLFSISQCPRTVHARSLASGAMPPQSLLAADFPFDTAFGINNSKHTITDGLSDACVRANGINRHYGVLEHQGFEQYRNRREWISLP